MANQPDIIRLFRKWASPKKMGKSLRFGLLAFATFFSGVANAGEIVVIKGTSDGAPSSLPLSNGQAFCRVTKPLTMTAEAWAAYRQIHIHGAIDVLDSVRLKQALISIELDDSVTSITISICSPGGLYFEAPRMIKVIREFSKKSGLQIITSAVGRGAWSAGAMVWLAGDILQIDQAGGAVGFHAAYDPRDLSKAEELTPEIKS